MGPSVNFPSLIADILFVLIAVIFIAVGAKRGFIKSLIQSAKFLLAFIITYFVGPIVSQFVNERFISSWVNKVGVATAEKIIPAAFRPDPEAIGEGVLPYTQVISNLISNIIAYVVVFVLALVLLTVVAWLLTKITDKIALLGTANRILGGLFGTVMGLVVLTIIACIIKFLDTKDVIYSQTVIVEFLGNILA